MLILLKRMDHNEAGDIPVEKMKAIRIHNYAGPEVVKFEAI